MTPCGKNDIKELLAAYKRGTVVGEEQARVEAHLASCEDCRFELTLLQAMTQDTVPDPGDEFWAAMPDRVFQKVRSGQRRSRTMRALRDFFDNLPVRSWAAAGAMAALLIVSGLVLTRSMGKHPEAPALSGGDAVYEHGSIDDALDVAALGPDELATADRWADRELFVMVQPAGDSALIASGAEFEDEVADLTASQLRKLSSMLASRTREG